MRQLHADPRGSWIGVQRRIIAGQVDKSVVQAGNTESRCQRGCLRRPWHSKTGFRGVGGGTGVLVAWLGECSGWIFGFAWRQESALARRIWESYLVENVD